MSFVRETRDIEQMPTTEDFQSSANRADCAMLVQQVYTPSNDVPGMTYIRSIGDNPKSLFEYLLNEELITMYAEEFGAECRRFYNSMPNPADLPLQLTEVAELSTGEDENG